MAPGDRPISERDHRGERRRQVRSSDGSALEVPRADSRPAGASLARRDPAALARPWVLLVVALLVLVSLATPLTEDVLVAFGAAFQARQLPAPFPINVYHGWLLRGFGYKLVVYVLDRAVELFVDARRPLLFESAVKTLYYGALSLMIYGACRLSRRTLAKAGLSPGEAAALCLLGVLTGSQWMQLQAEELAVVLVLGMMATAVAPWKTVNYLSGLFPPLLFAVKYVTVEYAAIPIAVLIFLGPAYAERLKRVVLGSLAAGAAAVVVWVYALPLDLADGRDAMLFQTAISHRRKGPVEGFVLGFAGAMQHAPLLLTGLVLAGVSLSLSRRRMGPTMARLVTVFFLSAVTVVVQAKWFGYHYASFLLFSLFAILLALCLDPSRKGRWYGLVVGVTLATWLLSVLAIRGLGPFRETLANENDYALTTYEPRMKTLRRLDREFDLSRQPEMLFLSDGTANYVIRCRSYLRYFFPLPLQRAQFNEALRGSAVYRQQLAAALAYRGEYVYLEPDWFDLDRHPALKRKLAAEYEAVFAAPREVAVAAVVLLRRRGSPAAGE